MTRGNRGRGPKPSRGARESSRRGGGRGRGNSPSGAPRYKSAHDAELDREVEGVLGDRACTQDFSENDDTLIPLHIQRLLPGLGSHI